ncbi:HAMP domain-containing protein [Deinococcus psychrotolerans]|uniref:histidine kinase n=1 Tax=Deinococcus psychrotolerans TaxID=2489213 RepID=A0A3G8YHI1_9DEIO|nr:HAMP domain-containing protein [Deinococcus psychrotolerans]AZI43667.1 HAMP domain-containing protein [Deinococcus psychrotolerans]
MKYTVVIEQAVPEDALPQLQQLLSERFHLSADQARKLASRRGGRLMKPTGKERASVLLGIFQEVGAKVRLEQVSDTDEAALPTAPTRSAPVVMPLENRRGDLHATEFGQVVAREQSVATLAAPVIMASAPSSPVSPPAVSPPAPAGDDFWNELSAPVLKADGQGGVPMAAPTSSGLMGGSTDDGLFLPDVGSLPPTPSAPQLTKTSAPSDDDLFAPEGLQRPGRPAAAAGAQGGVSSDADSWSDFAGSLTMTDVVTAPKTAQTVPELILTPEPERQVGRRQPLSRRLTIASVTPLAVYTLLTLTTLGLVLNASQRSLISNSAATIAAAVGSVLNTTDQNTVNQQLGTLLNRESVGFVQVELPDGTTFFRSQAPGLDAVLGERVGTWVKSNPSSGVFVQSQTPAQLYNDQLQQLVSVGAQDSEPAAALKRAIASSENQSIVNRNFQVERIGVYARPDGTRETKSATAKITGTNTLLYRIAVGVPIDSANAQLRNTLLALLLAGLAAMLIGAALAARAARRIVEPIERLVKAADAISLGDLSQSVKAEANDEVGDLAQALERMRLSLDAAMERLRKRRKV